jgi:hypothetical protein
LAPQMEVANSVVWMLCRVLVERKKPGMRPAASASRHRRARAATQPAAGQFQ